MIEYRKAGLEDINELVRMRTEFLAECQAKLAKEDCAELKEALREYFLENMGEGRFVAWLAADDGSIVGTSGVCFYRLPPSYKNPSGKVAYIMNMYTRPTYRGRGIAPILFSHLIEEAKLRDCKEISLHATQMGKPVYEKFGFTLTVNEMALKLQE